MQRSFPQILRDLHKLEFDYADGEGIDFEPYDDFLSVAETESWFRAWTGSPDASGAEFLIFGQDGTGGLAAIWHIRDNEDLLSQPIVFFGSEGEMGVVAQNFSDYLWVLASGHGPLEAIAYPDDARSENPDFKAFAERFASTPPKRLSNIVEVAKAEFSFFEKGIESLCR
ncbi:SMI1/KNR4 family protein [Chitinibacter fontanus]|uniref:SMI1/KNR4 family protein n=1 Tax=Chitinibacter fontanus TaxID=1737446 RepID=A0A7D5ZKD2_9NEIS|nr:SMI1/KNR4 family protein [Chitinibacter fontanus]